MKKSNKIRGIVFSAVIAALYVILTEICTVMGLSSGVIQVRISEALNAFCIFTPYAIPGLFIGCIISNLLAGGIVFDIIFGSIATLIGAVFAYIFRKKVFLSLLCPVISNAIIVPFVLKYAYGFNGSLWFFVLTVGIGEIISAGILGYLLFKVICKKESFIAKLK